MDVVSEVLRVSNFRGTLGARIAAGSAWSLELEQYPGMAMHAVLDGAAWLVSDGAAPPLLLHEGDVVLVPAHTPHRLTDRADGEGVSAAFPVGGSSDVTSVGTGPVSTRLLSVFYGCDHTTRTQVVDEMCGLIHITEGAAGAAYLNDVVSLLGRELDEPRLASAAVVDNLIQIVLIRLVRAWVASRPTRSRGTWLGWTDDAVVGRAVALVHEDPAADLTTTTLAAATSVSRATLTRRFTGAMGLTPADYVLQWRMDLAAMRLRDEDASVETIAATVGYRSVPSFTRAFARDRGRTPGAYRTQHRAQHPTRR